MTTLAPGIFLFDSGIKGPRRLYSAGIHGDEVEGQKVINAVLKGLESGRVEVTSGSVMIILANLQAIQDCKRVASDGCDFNRSFNKDEHPRIVEIKKWVNSFKPTLHRDLHCTIQNIPFSFALCSRAKVQPVEAFYDFALRFSIHNIVQFIYKADRKLTTFAGYTAQNFGSESCTIELGQIASSRARRMVPKVITAIFSEITDRGIKRVIPEVQLWQMGKKITKQTEHFQFTRQFENFEQLQEEEVVARDAEETHIAGKDSFILFANSHVPIGGRAAVFITKE